MMGLMPWVINHSPLREGREREGTRREGSGSWEGGREGGREGGV